MDLYGVFSILHVKKCVHLFYKDDIISPTGRINSFLIEIWNKLYS